jgi:hypothetical protein
MSISYGIDVRGLKGRDNPAQGLADEKQEPKATAGRDALG